MKNKSKQPFISKIAFENFMMTFVLPYSGYMYLKSKRRFELQTNRIMQALESNQELVDKLADAEFDLSEDGYCVLSSIQILQNASKISAQIDPMHVKRAIVHNISELLEDSKELANEITFITNDLSSSVIEVVLTPTWLNSYLICKEDFKRSVIASGLMIVSALLTWQQISLF